MKKTYLVLLSLFLVSILLFAGCSKQQATQTETTPLDQDIAALDQAAEESPLDEVSTDLAQLQEDLNA